MNWKDVQPHVSLIEVNFTDDVKFFKAEMPTINIYLERSKALRK